MKFLTVTVLFFLSHSLNYGLALPNRGGGRIVGGFPIPLSEAPYQVSVLLGGIHSCGGRKSSTATALGPKNFGHL